MADDSQIQSPRRGELTREEPVDSTDLISRLLDGDSEAVGTVRVWVRAAFGLYRSRLAPDLDDLEQEILLDLIRALREEKFRGASRLQTYVRAYARHKCIDRLRAQGRRQWLDVEEMELPSRDPTALDRLARSESLQLALRVFEKMPESCRELWQMLQQGMRYQEMSDRLGVAEGTLRARVLRCRKRALEARDRLFSADQRNKTR